MTLIDREIKKAGFLVAIFLRDFRHLRRIFRQWIAPKWLEIDHYNVRMIFWKES